MHNIMQAFFYHKGEGTDKDIDEAFKWYHQAAERGNAEAQNKLGFCYDTGLGVKIDHMKAFEWYRKSAKKRLAKAQCNLAICYYYGTGVDKNYNKAFEWFFESAKQEYLDAQYAMGLCYYKGQGVKQDYKEAVNWYRKAAEQNHAGAQYELGCCYFEGLVEAPCTIFQIREPNMNKKHKSSFEDYLASLPKEFPYGRRYREALVWYRKAADNGHQEAVRFLPKVEDKAKDEEIWERGKMSGWNDWMIWVDQKLK